MSGADGHSPIGADDNEEVRQRSAFALNSWSLPLSQGACATQPSPRTSTQMHLPQHPYPSPVCSPMSGHDNSGTLADSPLQLSENHDFCSACGGSGYLLCCDGCDRSFHFTCLDPPLNENASELNEPWFCFKCVARRPVVSEQPEKLQRGLFAPLLSSLRKRNPSNFILPQDLRDWYQHVHTDKLGGFGESVNPKTR